MPVFPPAQLEEMAMRLFQAAGVPEDMAAEVSRSLAANNGMGHDSHGVIRIPGYVDEIEHGSMVATGRPIVEKETATTAVINANWGPGIASARFATKLAIEKARKSQVAIVCINHCNHIGRVGEYTEMAAKEGMIGMVACGVMRTDGTPGCVAPFGGADPRLGTNPISMAVPGPGGRPIVLDYATSVSAEGKVRVARAKGVQVPPGTILDKDGNPTTDPNDLYNGGVLLPFGQHKGYALSVMVELLGGYLSASELYSNGLETFGTFIMVADISAFRPLDQFAEAVSGRMDEIKSARPAPGFKEVLVPGEAEQRVRDERAKTGIFVPDDTMNKLRDTAAKLGVADAVPAL